jgi:hypothetical protein
MMINDHKSGKRLDRRILSQKEELTHQKFDQFSLRTLRKSLITFDNSIEIWLAEVARASRPPVVPRGNSFPQARVAHERRRSLSFSNHPDFVLNDQIIMAI